MSTVSSPKEVEQFLDLLLAQPLGQILACNIVDCVDAAILRHARVVATLQEGVAEYAVRRPNKPRDLVTLLAATWHRHHFAGPRANSGEYPVEHAHLCSWMNFMRLLDPLKLQARGVTSVVKDPVRSPTAAAQRRRLDALSGESRVLPGTPATWGWRVLWLAPAEAATSPPGSADEARDRSGLVHQKRDTTLIRIALPPDKAAGYSRHRPSFADAGTHTRFRVRVDRTGPAHCGRTVDLALHRTSSVGATVDGVLETVLRPIPFDAGLGASWRCFGVTDRDGETGDGGFPSRSEAHRVFVRRLLRRRRLAEIRDRIRAMCLAPPSP
jgi:hypothetical protein